MIRKILAFSIALIFIFPIFFLITSSFKNNIDLFSLPPKLFLFNIDFSAYERVFGFSKLLKFDPSYGELYLTSRILDSLIVGIGSSSLTLIIGIYAGYYISRANFKYKNFLIITPGIRMPGDNLNDQARVMTPKDAFKNKVSGVVIGRSLTKGNIKNNIKKLIDHLN